MATEHELEILAKYSTLDLKRSVLTRFGKYLNILFTHRTGVKEREELLDKLYPPEKTDAP